MAQEEYLGDGVYASCDFALGFIVLRSPCEGGDNLIYLNGDVFRALVGFAEKTAQPREDNDG